MEDAVNPVLPSVRKLRWCGVLGILGGATWMASWVLAGITEGGVRTVLGMSEPGWSRMGEPALLALCACLFGFNVRYTRRAGGLGRAGFAISLLALATMLAGNLLEYWAGVLGIPASVSCHGWTMQVAGFMLLPVGWILLGIAASLTGAPFAWPRTLPLAFGMTMLLLFLQVFLVMFLTGVSEQEAWFPTPLVVTGLGWIALGCALFTQKPTEDVS